jgi:hypothetical protein
MNTTTRWGYFNLGTRLQDRSGRCLVAFERQGKMVVRMILYLN